LSQRGAEEEAQVATEHITAALGPFFVFQSEDWLTLGKLTMLDDRRRDRLPNEVNEILFLWVWYLGQPDDVATARGLIAACDRALKFGSPRGPWEALRARYTAAIAGESPPQRPVTDPAVETSALACFEWSLLSDLEGRRDWAIAWLERAVQLE